MKSVWLMGVDVSGGKDFCRRCF